MDGKKVLLPRAREAREVLPEELRKAGAQVDVLPVYETVPAAAHRDEVLQRLEAGTLDAVTFGSSSTVDNFFAQIPADTIRNQPEGKAREVRQHRPRDHQNARQVRFCLRHPARGLHHPRAGPRR